MHCATTSGIGSKIFCRAVKARGGPPYRQVAREVGRSNAVRISDGTAAMRWLEFSLLEVVEDLANVGEQQLADRSAVFVASAQRHGDFAPALGPRAARFVRDRE